MSGRERTPVDAASQGIAGFLAEIAPPACLPDPVAVFHAVRRLPYLSSGDRSLAGVLDRRAGSCSGKHILLAALLRQIGVAAEVELVEGDFATPLNGARDIPDSFRDAAAAGIPDIHNVVRAEIGGVPLVLDATWHDAVKRYGFRVNDGWTGEGDTVVAVDVGRFLGPAADPAAAKAAVLETWPAEVLTRRRAFLEDINIWVASLR